MPRCSNASQMSWVLPSKRPCRGGDPLAIVETAVSELKLRSRRRGAYVGQAILLDADRRETMFPIAPAAPID